MTPDSENETVVVSTALEIGRFTLPLTVPTHLVVLVMVNVIELIVTDNPYILRVVPVATNDVVLVQELYDKV